MDCRGGSRPPKTLEAIQAIFRKVQKNRWSRRSDLRNSEKLIYKKVKPRCVHTSGPWTPPSAGSTLEWGLVVSLFFPSHTFSLTHSLINPLFFHPVPLSKTHCHVLILGNQGLTHQLSCQAYNLLVKLHKLLRTLWFLLFLLTTSIYKSWMSPWGGHHIIIVHVSIFCTYLAVQCHGTGVLLENYFGEDPNTVYRIPTEI